MSYRLCKRAHFPFGAYSARCCCCFLHCVRHLCRTPTRYITLLLLPQSILLLLLYVLSTLKLSANHILTHYIRLQIAERVEQNEEEEEENRAKTDRKREKNRFCDFVLLSTRLPYISSIHVVMNTPEWENAGCYCDYTINTPIHSHWESQNQHQKSALLYISFGCFFHRNLVHRNFIGKKHSFELSSARVCNFSSPLSVFRPSKFFIFFSLAFGSLYIVLPQFSNQMNVPLIKCNSFKLFIEPAGDFIDETKMKHQKKYE